MTPTHDLSTSARATTATDPTSALRICCFGSFDVQRDDIPIKDWRRGKARTLLKVLVDRRHPVPREVMLDLLWPEADARSAGNNLRVTLHALRQALGSNGALCGQPPDWVIVEGGNVQLNPEVPLWVDVDEFTTLFQSACQKERQQRLDEAIRDYEQAEALYRDDYLIEDLYEDWTQARREELKDQYLLIVTKLTDYCLQRRDMLGCILRCHKILQKDACREDAYQRLMYAYAHLGRPSQALHWYEVCLRTLKKELDLGPSEQTVRLHARVLAREEETSGALEPRPDPVSRAGFSI